VTALRFMGTGDAPGVPRAYCDCPVCTEARRTGQNRRTRPSIFIEGKCVCWIDCGPDWRTQMERANLRGVDVVLVTHAHHDHIGGLPDLADSCLWSGKRTKVVGRGVTLAEIEARYPWIGGRVELVEHQDGQELGDFRTKMWEVNHGHNGMSHAVRFDSDEFSWVYCPDGVGLTVAQQEPLVGLDLLVLGVAFPHEQLPVARRSLYDLPEALDLVRRVKPRRVIFTHLSHGWDINLIHDMPSHCSLAHDGMRVVHRGGGLTEVYGE